MENKVKFIQKVTAKETIFEGHIFNIVKKKIEKKTIKPIEVDSSVKNYVREIVDMKNAVAVAIVNKSNDKMLLVKQYRSAVENDVWEIPAGMLDVEGEKNESCAVREVEEETNIKMSEPELSYLISTYGVIGCCNHKVYIYSAIIDETSDCSIKEDDVVARKWFTMDEIDSMIKEGIIEDGKTQLAYFILNSTK